MVALHMVKTKAVAILVSKIYQSPDLSGVSWVWA